MSSSDWAPRWPPCSSSSALWFPCCTCASSTSARSFPSRRLRSTEMPVLPPRWRLVLLVLLLVSLPIAAGVLWLILTGAFDRVHGLVPVKPPDPRNWRFLWGGICGRPPPRVPLGKSLVFSGRGGAREPTAVPEGRVRGLSVFLSGRA